MIRPPRFVRWLIALQAVLLLPARSFPQLKTQKWTEVRSPHFLVVTNGSDRQGRQLAYQFEAIRSVFEQTLRVRVDPGRPFIVLGFKDERSLRAAMPEFWKKKGQVQVGGGFLSGQDKIYAFVRLDVEEENPYRIIYHEYTHMILHLGYRSLPLWMSEGLAEFYGFSVIGEKQSSLGRPDAGHIMTLRETPLLPLPELFRVTYDSPEYTVAAKARLFYAESWALTHYLMLGEKTEAGQSNRLTEFLSLLGQGVDPDEATRQVFSDPADLQAALERYVKHPTFRFVWVSAKVAATPKDFGARILPPAEAASMLGDFELHDRRPRDAKLLLEEALRLQPDLASAQESLGFVFMRLGDRAEALRSFDRVIAAGSGSFLAHYYHAVLTLNELGTEAGAAEAEAGLAKALQLNPDFAPAYIALAKIYLGDDRKVGQALELVREAVILEPGNFSYQMMLGNVLLRSGRFGEALKLAETLERSAGSQPERDMVQSFIESLKRAQEKKGPK